MNKKTSIQDIANELNLSRNTVSKAFNNQYLPEKTKIRILNKAIEMGYKNLASVASREAVLNNKNILILTTNDIQNLNFFLAVLRGINSIVNKYELNLFQYRFDTLQKIKDFRNYCRLNKIDGILCIETFENRYINHILSLNIPVVFIDGNTNSLSNKGDFDIVLMESLNSVKETIMNTVKSTRIRKLGFVGDSTHCMSFKERFIGYREALYELNIKHDKKFDINEPDEFPYGDLSALSNIISKKETIPECYVCANDFLAISMIDSLNSLNIRVPQDVQIIGFDNTHEAKNYRIPLTTIDTDKELLGKEAIATLLNRIKYKEARNRVIYIKTSPIYRESTK